MAETNIPNLSIATTDAASHNSAPTFTLPVGATATLAGATTASGQFTSTSTVNLQAAKLLSKVSTGSFTSATLADGEMAVGAVSASSCIIYVRSGVTTYRFIAPIAGAVL